MLWDMIFAWLRFHQSLPQHRWEENSQADAFVRCDGSLKQFRRNQPIASQKFYRVHTSQFFLRRAYFLFWRAVRDQEFETSTEIMRNRSEGQTDFTQ